MNSAVAAVRILVTTVATIIAIVLLWFAWRFYAYSPWTRDGRVRVLVVSVAPEVSGKIVQLNVRDNQFKKKGDLLVEIDPAEFIYARDKAQATVDNSRASMELARSNLARAQRQTDLSITGQQREQAYTNAATSLATYNQDVALLNTANLNLERTKVRSTVDGPVTNLQVDLGSYASNGSTMFAQSDANSFYVYGYFEETKLRYIAKGDRASIRLMGYDQPLEGYVKSIASVIADADNTTQSSGVAKTDPTFTWVRLAQRIPVHVAIDKIPEGITVTAGMTATIVIENKEFEHSLPGIARSLFGAKRGSRGIDQSKPARTGDGQVDAEHAPSYELYPVPLPQSENNSYSDKNSPSDKGSRSDKDGRTAKDSDPDADGRRGSDTHSDKEAPPRSSTDMK